MATKKTSKKKPVGRPTKYLPRFLKEAYLYIDRCVDIQDEFHKTRGEKSDSYERTLEVQLPTIEGFALVSKVAVSTLYLWAEKYPQFSEALDIIKMKQKEVLLAKGLSGDYSPVIAKLILSSNHGMTDRNDVTTQGDKLPTPIIPLNVLRDNSDEENSKTKKED